MPNVFDQFDAAVAGAGPGNLFDQFDGEAVPSSGVTIVPKGGVAREAEVQTPGMPVAGREALAGLRMGSLSSAQAFGRAALELFVNNLLAVPSALGDALRVNPLADAGRVLSGRAPEPVLGSTPRISLNDIRAALEVASQAPEMVRSGELNPLERFNAAQQAQAAAEAQRRVEAPIATRTGEVFGDVLTLVAGRAPIARAISRAPARTPAAAPTIAPGLQREVTKVLQSGPAKKLARGAGRAAETGLEGALLAALNGGDPAETAALAAGGQAFGSLALTLGKLPLSVKGLVFTAAGATALIQLFQTLTPGGRDRILSSAESAFNKIGYGMLLGGLAGIMGAGRLRGSEFAESFPKIADAISTAARGPWISLWKDFTKEDKTGENRIEPVLTELAENPETFTTAERNQLKRALTSEGVSISAVLNRLSRKPGFRAKLDALTGAPQ